MKENNKHATNPIDSKQEIQHSNDEHIDQDFEGFPNNPSTEEKIKPETEQDKLNAAIGTNNYQQQKKANSSNEDEAIISNGSAGAFNATERLEDVDSEPKTDKPKASY